QVLGDIVMGGQGAPLVEGFVERPGSGPARRVIFRVEVPLQDQAGTKAGPRRGRIIRLVVKAVPFANMQQRPAATGAFVALHPLGDFFPGGAFNAHLHSDHQQHERIEGWCGHSTWWVLIPGESPGPLRQGCEPVEKLSAKVSTYK